MAETTHQSHQWTWDAERQSYCWWNPVENAFVYQDGTKVYAHAPIAPSYGAANTHAAPRSTAARRPSSSGYSQSSGHFDQALGLGTLSLAESGSSQSASPPSHGNYLATTPSPYTAGYPATTYPGYSQVQGAQARYYGSAFNPYGQTIQTGTIQGYGNPPRTTDYSEQYDQQATYTDARQQQSAPANQRGAGEQSKTLDPRFKPRDSHFFKKGKFFKTWWAEPEGQFNEGATSVVIEQWGNERVAVKIKWFVVIREGHQHCVCLPISTYGNRGVAKPGVNKSHHSIIYSGKKPPEPRDNERPSRRTGERGMRPAIKIKMARPGDKIEEMSRINFGRMYTIEHYSKAFDVGDVHKDSYRQFKRNYAEVEDECRSVQGDEVEEDQEAEGEST